MSVEIKMLDIKITVQEPAKEMFREKQLNGSYKRMKREIVHECKREILEELKQRQRR